MKRAVYIRCKLHNSFTIKSVCIAHILQKSNDLNVNVVASCEEITTGHTKRIVNSGPRSMPKYLHVMRIMYLLLKLIYILFLNGSQ